MHQICYLLAEVQKPGSDQGQVWGVFALVGPWRHIWDIIFPRARCAIYALDKLIIV